MKNSSPVINEGTECDFCRLLREVLAGSKPVDALFEHPKVKERGLLICKVLTHNQEDAEDLFQEVCLRVARNIMDNFSPDLTRHFGNFFAWFKTIATHKFIDDLPTSDEQFVDESSDELLNLKEDRTDTEVQFLCYEIEERIKKLPREARLSIEHFLEGYSLREIKLKLKELGIERSHTSIRKDISEGLKPFFPDTKALFASKHTRKRKRTRPHGRVAAVG